MAAIDRFRASMSEARDLLGLFRSLRPLIAPSLDTTDILRASWVFSVGALDSYVHTKVEDGLLAQSLATPSSLTPRAGKISVSLNTFVSAATGGYPTMEAQIRAAITDAIGWQTFQKPDRLTEALKLLKADNFWIHAAGAFGITEDQVKAALTDIVNRRNKIAHEGDRTVAGGGVGSRTPINDTEVDTTHRFIETLVTSIEGFLP